MGKNQLGITSLALTLVTVAVLVAGAAGVWYYANSIKPKSLPSPVAETSGQPPQTETKSVEQVNSPTEQKKEPDPAAIEPIGEKKNEPTNPVIEATKTICGNGVCDKDETATSCAKDCVSKPVVEQTKEVTPQIELAKTGTPCGGWSQAGGVVCECDGKLKKSTCPDGAMCDGGTDICYGTCGECKCSFGENTGQPCTDGRDIYFTDICSRKLSAYPSEKQKEACSRSGGKVQCTAGSCRCSCECAKEGEFTKILELGGGYRECCAGLTRIKTQYEVSVGSDGKCQQQADKPLEVGICTKCGDGICSSGEVRCNCSQDCSEGCAKTGQQVFLNAGLGPTTCCSAGDGIKPNSIPQSGACTAASGLGPIGICTEGWQETCGDGICRAGENKCNCKDCSD